VCGDRELARRLGVAARKQVAERADYEQCTDALESLYFDLVDKINTMQAETT
jgi:hypothetical protein